jgi:hypothetical protein
MTEYDSLLRKLSSAKRLGLYAENEYAIKRSIYDFFAEGKLSQMQYNDLISKLPPKPSIPRKIFKLIKKELGFTRHDEITGHPIFSIKNKRKYEYRGVTIWAKEVIESIFAWAIIILGIFLVIVKLVPAINSNCPEQMAESIRVILGLAGLCLATDAVFLISTLISSPGIDEIIDSITVSIAAFLVLTISQVDISTLLKMPLQIMGGISLLAVLIGGLLLLKHHLKGTRITNAD